MSSSSKATSKTFVKRVGDNLLPEKSNPYYTKTSSGGYSSCELGNTHYLKRLWDGCTLPNCVGWAFGRFNEIGAFKSMKYAWSGNARDLYKNAPSSLRKKKGNYATPKEGAMIVWSYPNGGYGHVAIIEEVKDDNTIIVSESGWSYKKVYAQNSTYKKGSTKNWHSDNSQFIFEGFVYHPSIAYEELDTYDVSQGSSQESTSKTQSSTKTALDYFNEQALSERQSIDLSNTRGMDLLSSQTFVESPFIIATIGEYTFGSYTKSGSIYRDRSSMTVTYPNYMDSITIVKTNGMLNQYTLNMVYQITAGNDPNLLDRIFSSVSNSREIVLSYGDWALPTLIYQNEEALITKISSNIDFANQRITYQLSCTSKALKASSSTFPFDPVVNEKGSDVIKRLLWHTKVYDKYGLLEVFPGMVNENAVLKANLIPGDDKQISIEAQTGMDPIKYLDLVVASMTADTNTNSSGTINDSVYHFVIMDDLENEFGGPYFKIVRTGVSTKTLTTAKMYEVDIGYPTNTLVTSFNINTDNSWSILYDYSTSKESINYTYSIDDDGKVIVNANNSAAINAYYNKTTDSGKNWWTKMTQFPITATLTIKGLLRPAILMEYVKINAYFYGQKHISSGIYVITKQEDTINSSGYRTVLSLTRIAGDEDDSYSYVQTSTSADATTYNRSALFRQGWNMTTESNVTKIEGK